MDVIQIILSLSLGLGLAAACVFRVFIPPLMMGVASRFDLYQFEEGIPLTIAIKHNDKTSDQILCNHTYNQSQIECFNAGSALNLIRSQES